MKDLLSTKLLTSLCVTVTCPLINVLTRNSHSDPLITTVMKLSWCDYNYKLRWEKMYSCEWHLSLASYHESHLYEGTFHIARALMKHAYTGEFLSKWKQNIKPVITKTHVHLFHLKPWFFNHKKAFLSHHQLTSLLMKVKEFSGFVYALCRFS